MKKIIIFIAIITFAAILCSCGAKVNAEVGEPVSAIQSGLIIGSNDNFLVKIVYGKAEKPEAADGVVGTMTGYATLEVTPLKLNLINNKYTYTLGGMTGELTPNDIRLYFRNDISSLTEAQLRGLKNITICLKDSSEEIELTNAMSDFVKTDSIIATAKSQFADFVSQNSTNGKPNYEINLKLVNSKNNPASPYYWYVTFASAKGSVAAVIDPMTGAVLAKK